MASGEVSQYSNNALAAVKGTKTCGSGGCPSCVKAGLPVLLARPGLAETRYAGKSAVYTQRLMAQLMAPDLKHSNYVMRTLRTGYVYVYYEAAAMHSIVGGEGWEVFAVDEAGYVTPVALELPPLPEEMPRFSCERTEGYAAGMLINIKEPSAAGIVWIGFSEVPLSLEVRRRYVAQPEVRARRFTRLNASTGESERALELNEQNVRNAMCDYDVERGKLLEALRGNPHRPGQVILDKDGRVPERPTTEEIATHERREGPRDIVMAARSIADASRGRSAIGPIILGVSDAVGMAHEAAHLRITLPSKAVKWLLAQQDGARRLQTAVTMVGLQEMLVQQANVREEDFKQRNPVPMYGMDLRAENVTKTEFEARQKAGVVPSSATWSPIAMAINGPFGSGVVSSGQNGYGNIKVLNGSFEADARVLIEKIKKKSSRKIRDPTTGKSLGWEDFLVEFGRFSTEDKALRKRIQGDHRDLLRWPGRSIITDFDFDESNPADGVYYSQVVGKILHGGPIDDDAVEWYADYVKEDPSNKDNLLVRAMLGNQKEHFDQFVGWAGEDGQRSKASDIINNVLDLAEKLAENQQGGRASALAVKHIGILRLLARGYASPLMAMAGAVALGADRLNRSLPAGFYDKLLALLSSIVKTGGGLTHLVIEAPLRLAGRAWRKMSVAFSTGNKAAEKTAVAKVKSLVVGGGDALQLAGAGEAAERKVRLHLWTDRSESELRALQAKAEPGQVSVTAQPAPGSVSGPRTGAALSAAAPPLAIGSVGLMNLAAATPKVLMDAPTVMSAGAGVIQAMEIAKALKKMEVGTTKERREAIFSFFSAGLGVVSAFVDVAKAYAQRLLQKAAVKRLEMTVALFAALGSFIDSAQSFLNAKEDYKNGRGVAALHLLQAASFFAGGVAFVIYAAAAVVQGFGVATSWLGWGILLIVLGFALGFVASIFMTLPIEDWAARTLWGEGYESWDSVQTELQELNKVLLGVEIDAQFRGSINWRNAKNATDVFVGEIVQRMTAFPSEVSFTREFVVKLRLAEHMRKRLNWSVVVFGNPASGGSRQMLTTCITNDVGSVGANWGVGVTKESVDDSSMEMMTISGHVRSGEFRDLFVVVSMRDALVDGDVIVQEQIMVE